ncbi:MAG TPA: hypothetical protein VF790_04880 [Dissulfurispiraceae bacterium]
MNPESDDKTFALLAILYELNDRELKRKLAMFPEERRYYAVLANSIIGAENSRRVNETPGAVVQSSEDFVAKLLEMTNPEQDKAFRDILETCLVETLKDELKFCCANCMRFTACLDIENSQLGALFRRRVHGEETNALKKEIARHVANALGHTPHLDTDEADMLCSDFEHQYDSSRIGEVFGRYAEIASSLRGDFGLDYTRFQKQMLSANMHFYEKSREK